MLIHGMCDREVVRHVDCTFALIFHGTSLPGPPARQTLSGEIAVTGNDAWSGAWPLDRGRRTVRHDSTSEIHGGVPGFTEVRMIWYYEECFR